MSDSNDLNVRVDANTSGFESAIARAQAATQRYDDSIRRVEQDLIKLQKELDDEVSAALERQHEAMTNTGKAAFVFGAAIAGGLALATNEAVKWETAWAGVTKTVNGSGAEMDQLEKDLRGLATTLPTTHEEIAGIAEAAGQLGIQRGSIVGFTKTMVDLATSTNLTADQAATDMARFANIMATPQDEIDRLGASLVALGNDGASTEADILSMAMRIAGAGHQLGLTEGEVMGIANALSSVGIEAEAGGSAISQVMKIMQVAVSTGSDKLDSFARVADMSTESFTTLWKQDSAAGIDKFVTGLGNIAAGGGDVISVLNDMGFTQIRQSDVLLRLAGAGDLLTESLQLGNEAWDENSALLAEANKRYDTTASKVAIARNELADAAITAGDVLLPALAAVAGTVSDMMRAWQDVPGPLKTALVILAVVAAAVALLGGTALMAVPKIAAFQVAVAGLNAGALKTAGTRLIGMSSILAGPWGLAIAGGIAALGIFAAKHGSAARDVDALKATLDEQTGAISDNSRQWAIKKMSDDGVLQAAKSLGIDLKTVTEAALGNAAAIEEVNAALDGYAVAAQTGSKGASVHVDAQVAAADRIRTAVGDTNGTLADSREAWQLEREAMGGATDATKVAADAQAGTTQAWDDGADAAGDLTEEVTTLAEEMDALSGTYLTNRAAGRAVRGSLREIRQSLKEYRKEHEGLDGAFKGGTKSGDDFAAMLDGLAQDYQAQIDATAELTGSQKKTKQAYWDARKALVDVADQLGMTREEARKYAKQILGTPKMIKTHFEVDKTAAEQSLDVLTARLKSIAENKWYAHVGVRAPTVSDMGPNIVQADGGIVQAYANGGIAADGSYVDRVPQIASGKDIRWAEPTTGWEAYISGKPGMEARNKDVWLEAGRRLGVVPKALQQSFTGGRSYDGGGFAGGASAAAASMGGGIDYGRLADAFSRAMPPQPMIGQQTVMPHNYKEWERQMSEIQQLSNSGGKPTAGGRRR